jgi:hypothetical protein
MNTLIPSLRPDVVGVETSPRPTPAPARVHFSEVLASSAATLVRGAEAAINSLPGAPLLAVAVRPGAGMGPAPITPLSASALANPPAGNPAASNSAEGPTAGLTTGSGGAAGGGSGIESSIAQAQEMNLYYLQIQEEVDAQNRTFSALSNVLKAEHDTVKTAIGNIH